MLRLLRTTCFLRKLLRKYLGDLCSLFRIAPFYKGTVKTGQFIQTLSEVLMKFK